MGSFTKYEVSGAEIEAFKGQKNLQYLAFLVDVNIFVSLIFLMKIGALKRFRKVLFRNGKRVSESQASQSVSQSVSPSVSQSVSQSVNRSVGQSVTQSVTQSVSK